MADQKQKPEGASRQALSLRALLRSQSADPLLDRLTELAREAVESGDSYAIATFALAAIEAGKLDLARPAIERLRTMPQDAQGAAFWHHAVNTPFHGWGRAAQIETTALVVEALCKWRKKSGEDGALRELTDRGVLFLMRAKDRDGIWLSTQTTVRVLESILEAMPPVEPRAWTALVHVNGRLAGSIPIPAGSEQRGPLTLDVSPYSNPGVRNEVRVSGSPEGSATPVQFTADWYEPWNGPRKTKEFGFAVQYEKTEAAAGERIRCDVTVTRTAFQGYGMMIAEVGLPPGAEVDRGTLIRAGVDSAEVWPDRVIFYVWPNKPETKFSFWIRPRYPVEARTASSVLYDYYNPDARATLPPDTFRIQ